MRYIFLDIETTNEHLDFDIDNSELIEIGAYDINTNRQFSCFVKINHPLSEFTKRLTGITDEDIQKKGKSVEEAIKNLKEFIGNPNDVVLVGHNIEGFDIPVLLKYSDYFKEIKYLDTLQLFLLFFPGLEEYNVEFLYKRFVNSDYKEKHRGLEDAKDEAELFKKIFLDSDYIANYWRKNGKDLEFLLLLWKGNKDIKDKTKNFLSKIKDKDGMQLWNDFMSNNYIFDFIEIKFGQYLKKIDIEEFLNKGGNLSKDKVFDKFFVKFDYEILRRTKYSYDDFKKTSEDEIIDIYKKCLGNKKERLQQVEVIKNINKVLNQQLGFKASGIEAGTGVGKTYGYLIPVMNFLQKNPEYKVFVSTYTKVLQGQIMKKDIKEISKFFDNVKYTQLKANSEGLDLNFIPLVSRNFSLYHLILWIWIYWGNYYISDLHYIIQKKLNHFENTKFVYSPFNFSGEKDYNKIFGFKGYLQKQIKENNLFVVNHSFLLSQFGGYLRDTSLTGYFEENNKDIKFKYYVILDEGHNMEHVLREYFTLFYDILTFDKIFKLIFSKEGYNLLGLIKEEEKYIKRLIIEKSGKLSFEISLREIVNEILEKYRTNKYLDIDYIKNDFLSTDLYRLAKNEIVSLREKYISLDEVNFDQEAFYEYYLKDNNKFGKLVNVFYDLVREIYNTYNNKIKELKNIDDDVLDNFNSSVLRQLEFIGKYFKLGKDFLNEFENYNFFIEGFVKFKEGTLKIENFGFKMIPQDISKYNKVFMESEGSCFVSATLYDSRSNKSYILDEIFGSDNYYKFDVIKSPYNYKKQRKILAPYINIDNEDFLFEKKFKILCKYIDKYGGKTLILTTNNKDKNKLANLLFEKYNSKGILIKKHEGGTLNSRSNQQNIQLLRENPKTILIGSKSYMEGVDVPGENLSLVVLWKLPFLPPTPFIRYMDEKPQYRKIYKKFVYKFLSSILFRQSIGRLIRSETDKGEILILDPRILDDTGSFFREYLEDGEEIEIL